MQQKYSAAFLCHRPLALQLLLQLDRGAQHRQDR
jgi:hypothetical protein